MMFTNKDLKHLIVPLVIEQLLAITVGMVDTVMISGVGEAAISGVSLVDMINNLLNSVFAALATGGAVIVSQYIGKKKRDAACESANQLVLIVLIVSGVIMTLVLAFNKPLLSTIYGSVEPDVMKHAVTYLIVSAIGFPFLALFNACAALFRSMGNSKISMQVSLIMNITNAVGNAILIYGFGMGVAGAAIASTASRALAALILLYLATNKQNLIVVTVRNIPKWNRYLIRRILFIAIPSGIENGLFQLGRVLVVSIIAGFGTAQIAANAVANNLDNLGNLAGHSVNLAVITVVGRCIGAGDYKQAVYYTKKLLKIVYIMTLCVNVVLLGGLPWILKIFSLSAEAYHYAYILVWIHNGCAVFLWPIAFTLAYTLRAAGDVKFAMFISIFSMLTFRILFSVILGQQMGYGAIGVWIAMVLDWIFRAIMFGWRFIKGKWKTFQVV